MKAYQLACEDAGHDDCAFMVQSEDRDEVVELARTHARDVHDQELSRDDVRNVVSEIEWAASD